MLTYQGANALLNCLCGRSQSYSYQTVYVGLSTTTPNRSGDGHTEPTGNGYARVIMSAGSSQSATWVMGAAELGAAKNDKVVYFPEATGSWGTCTHFCLFSAPTGGVLIAYGALTDPISPVNGTVPIIRAGDLTMGIS